MLKPLPIGLLRAGRACNPTKFANIQQLKLEGIAGLHTSQKMAKFELAKKYHGLENNVW